MKKIVFFNKYQSVTYIVFRSVALVTKKLWAVLEFFVPYPMQKIL